MSAEYQETRLWLGGPEKKPKAKGKKAVKMYLITLFEAALTGQFIERKAAKSFLFSDHFSSTNVKNVLRAAVFKCQDLLLLFSSGAAKLGGAAPGLWSGGGPDFQTRLLTGAPSQLCLFWWRGARSAGQGGSGWRAVE